MSERSNWPASQHAVRLSNRSEPDESLYPSRIKRVQINPKIPRELEPILRDYLFHHRGETNLGIFVTEAIVEKLQREGWPDKQTGRPAVQPSSRPLIDQNDQIPITDEKMMIDHRSSSAFDHETGRPAVQFLEALRAQIPPRDFSTWLAPLITEMDGEVLVLTPPNRVVREFVETHYAAELSTAVAESQVKGYRWNVAEPPAAEVVETTPTETSEARANRFLNYYAVVTGNKLRPADFAKFAVVQRCSDDAIKSGILRSQLKAADPIGSFNYCVRAILQIEASGLGPRMVTQLEKEWQQSLPGMGGVLPFEGTK